MSHFHSNCSYYNFLGVEPCDKVAMLVDNKYTVIIIGSIIIQNVFAEFALKKSYVRSGVQSRKKLLFCQPTAQPLHRMYTHLSCNYYGYRVRKSPGISFWHFPGLESHGKRLLVLEICGNLLNSTKKYEVYDRQ